jgi:hypothetical protein
MNPEFEVFRYVLDPGRITVEHHAGQPPGVLFENARDFIVSISVVYHDRQIVFDSEIQLATKRFNLRLTRGTVPEEIKPDLAHCDDCVRAG